MIVTGARIPARELREGDLLDEGVVTAVELVELNSGHGVRIRIGGSIVELFYPDGTTLVELHLPA